MSIKSLQILLIPLTLFALVPLSCSKKPGLDIVQGVSLEIARHRAKTISNLHYQLHFSIPESLDQEITGQVVISLHLNDLSLPLIIDFNENPAKVIRVGNKETEINYEFINGHIVISSTYLKMGDISIVIDFIAGERSLNRNEKFLYTLFVPNRASFAFPCFDQPNLKAIYKLSLEIPETWQAVANGKLAKTKTSQGRMRLDFEETKLISTYLFSFAVGEFEVINEERNGRTMRMFHRETDAEKVQSNTKTIFDLHFAALNWLEEYTGIPYPFDKFDFVLIPSFQYGGMEHPGAILYRASRLFLERSATQNQKLGRASVIAHETAHMWFGNLVTMDWFNDVWMKEVFANFMAAKIVNPSFPEINHPLRFLLAHYPGAYGVDRTAGANPIRQDLDNLKNAGTLYGAIIYQKAPIVMKHLERLVGEKSFQSGLREYLHQFNYGNATWPDLIAILDKKSEEDLKAWSEVWVNQPGRPHLTTEITFDKNGNISKLLVKQEDSQNIGQTWNQLMDLVIVRDNSSQYFPVQMNQEVVEVKEAVGLPKPDFVLANGTGLGYGNFELDTDSRNFLLSNIHKIDDALLRGVAWITLWEEMLHFRVLPGALFNTAKTALQHENDTQNIERILSYLNSTFWKFHTDSQRRKLAIDIETLLWDLINKPMNPKAITSYFRTFRSIAITEKAVAKLLKIWQEKLTIPGLFIQENDMTTLCFELAVRGIPESEDVIRGQLQRIKSPDRKARFKFILPALSADQTVRDEFFESLKEDKNRSHEPWVLTGLRYLHHPIRGSQSQKYLRESLELLQEIQQTGDIFFPKRWLDVIFGGHNSAEAAEIVDRFLKDQKNYPDRLRGKILQSTDLLFRAVSISNEQ